MEGPEFVDFTKRGDDHVAQMSILGRDAPGWARSSYLRWKQADEASDRTGKPEDIRAWHVVADLPPSATAGQWVDGVTDLVTLALTPWGLADVAIHDPGGDIPAHAHILATSRVPGEGPFLDVDYPMHFCLDVALRRVWEVRVREFADQKARRDD